MITAKNEFETISAFESLAGSSSGTWTDRETTAELIRVLDLVQNQISTAEYYQDLAKCSDDDTQTMYEIQQEVAGHIEYYAPLPDCCSVTLQDNEWQVIPYIDEDLPRLEDIPETYTEDLVYQVNDHGNVSLYKWHPNFREYREVWAMV